MYPIDPSAAVADGSMAVLGAVDSNRHQCSRNTIIAKLYTLAIYQCIYQVGLCYENNSTYSNRL